MFYFDIFLFSLQGTTYFPLGSFYWISGFILLISFKINVVTQTVVTERAPGLEVNAVINFGKYLNTCEWNDCLPSSSST